MTMPDQAPQTLSNILRLHVQRVAEADRATRGIFKIDNETFKEQYDWSENEAKAALTALIERVIGEDEPKLVNGVRHPLPHHSHRNQLRAEQRKRLANLTKNGE